MKRWILAAFVVMVINLYGGTVNIHLKDGSVFTCDKVLSENNMFVIVKYNGKKLLLRKSLVEKIEKVDEVKKIDKKNKPIEEQKTKKEKKEALMIDDINFERTIFFDPYAKKEKKEVVQPADAIKIKVISQKVERQDNKIKFEGEVQNIFGKEVDSLKMIVSALDAEGKVVVENISQISAKLKDGEKAPFSFVFTDTNSNIIRFSYSFEAIVRNEENKE